MFSKMTESQKSTMKVFHEAGFSRKDSKIYAQKTSDFMFQTGVAYVSGVGVAATIGAAKVVGHGIGFVVGKTVDIVGGAISGAAKAAAPEGVDSKALKRAKKAEKKIRMKADNIINLPTASDAIPSDEEIEAVIEEALTGEQKQGKK